jgi:hypothetical protein
MCSVLKILPFEGKPMDWYLNTGRGEYLFTPEGEIVPHDVGTFTGSSFLSSTEVGW